MSNSSNQLSSLINQLSRSSSNSLNLSRFIQPLTLGDRSSSFSSGSTALASLGLKSLSEGASEKLQSIQFGKPSSDTNSTSSGSSLLGGLLSKTASGGLASALSGGLSSFAGLGGLISGITSLFGGPSKAASSPLVLFSLPDSIQQTAYVTSNRADTNVGHPVDASASSAIYTTSAVVNEVGRAPLSATTDSSSIAQAVKNALLTSNSLSDVIAEI